MKLNLRIAHLSRENKVEKFEIAFDLHGLDNDFFQRNPVLPILPVLRTILLKCGRRDF